ncbi:MAG: hypothetical protein ACRDA4_10130 [Filifactoraceae bacterium]
MAGKINKSEWFTDRILNWKNKKIALFMVGASPEENMEEIRLSLDKILNPEQKKYAKVFYCQGGLNYEKMNLFYKFIMKAFAKNVKKKDAYASEMLSKSYDISDFKFLDPIISSLEDDK